MKVATMRDVMGGQPTAEIKCMYRREVARRLVADFAAGTLTIHPTDGSAGVTVPLDTPVIYEPWVTDRGSLLFETRAVMNPDALPPACPPELKLCGDGDYVIYADGTRDVAQPAAV